VPWNRLYAFNYVELSFQINAHMAFAIIGSIITFLMIFTLPSYAAFAAVVSRLCVVVYFMT